MMVQEMNVKVQIRIHLSNCRMYMGVRRGGEAVYYYLLDVVFTFQTWMVLSYRAKQSMLSWKSFQGKKK